MINLEKSIEVNAPAEKVFNYISKPESMVEVIPSMMEVNHIHRSGNELKYHWAYKLAGIKFEGDSEDTITPNKHITSKSHGGIHSTWDWDLEPHGEDTTINLNVTYEIPTPVLGKIAERLVVKQNNREADLAMENIKMMLED